MIDLSKVQVAAIRSDPSLRSDVLSSLSSSELLTAPIDQMTDEQYDDLSNAAYDALLYGAVVVKEFVAEQDKGEYPVQVCGVPGAYFVQAPEYEKKGAFSTLREAIAYAHSEFGDFLVSEGDSESDVSEDAPPRGVRAQSMHPLEQLLRDSLSGRAGFGRTATLMPDISDGQDYGAVFPRNRSSGKSQSPSPVPSNKVSKQQMSPLEAAGNRIDAALRASGRTVTGVTDILAGQEYKVVFPPNRSSGKKAARRAPKKK